MNVFPKFQVVICGSRLQNSHEVEEGWKRFSHLNTGDLLWLEPPGQHLWHGNITDYAGVGSGAGAGAGVGAGKGGRGFLT